MLIEVSESEQKFLKNFICDEHLIAIPLNRYAWYYKHENNSTHYSDNPPSFYYDFIRRMAIKSQEDFKFRFAYDKESPVLLGSVLSHRVFSQWLINQEYKP
jgi:hypothetical protein